MPRVNKAKQNSTITPRRNVGPRRSRVVLRARPQTVEAYISKAPKEMQGRLREFRAIIREVAPAASESISYQMPSYDYKGKLAWFALSPSKSYIGLYLRPPIIEQHKDELARYVTTKSAIHFPLVAGTPVALVRRLVKERMRMNESEE